jgi:hypothetical protein
MPLKEVQQKTPSLCLPGRSSINGAKTGGILAKASLTKSDVFCSTVFSSEVQNVSISPACFLILETTNNRECHKNVKNYNSPGLQAWD